MIEADSIVDHQDYISRVKSIFRQSVGQLDPASRLEDTGYFNHSAVPDFVIHWSDEKNQRNIYLRRSFDEIAASHDLEALSSKRPVIVSMIETAGNSPSERELRRAIESPASQDTLITGGLALDLLNSAGRSTSPDSPISAMVNARLLRSGRGIVDADRAPALMSTGDGLMASVEQNFDETGTAELRDAVELVEAATSPSRGVPPPRSVFSIEEARSLLPWMLSRAQSLRRDEEFWAGVGARLSLKVLEGISEDIEGFDLTSLVRTSWHGWTAKRGYLGEAMPDDVHDQSPRWFIRNRLLTCVVNDNAMRFSTYGQAIKGRGGVSSATWEQISQVLPHGLRVTSITLRGVDRSVTLDANESSDVRSDADVIVASVSDRFYVDKLTVEFGSAKEERSVAIDLGERIVFGEDGATLRDLAQTLGQIVAYKDRFSDLLD